MRSLDILLASASPRRRALLETLGHRVLVEAVAVDEDERPGEGATAYIERVVALKLAAAIAHAPATGWDALLVADTVVELDGAILHKPVDAADGRRMLRTLADRAHVVTTRFALATPGGAHHVATPGGARHFESVATRVVFRALWDDEIDAYVASGEGDDKAGGYAIQGGAGAFVSRIEGSYGAVVGLPLSEVSVALRRLLGEV
ncbi:MAG: septum formation protein Maf [Deltaproteobacteria bacterium]|nr:septum formation protein Maf [Deltaproteobacteria bacterium]